MPAHTWRGSTSMRVPGAGWPADASASASSFDPAARTRKWPAVTLPTSTARSEHARPRDEVVGAVPAHQCECGCRGKTELCPSRLLGSGEPAGVGMQGCGQDLVIRQSRPDNDAPFACAGRRPPVRRGRAEPAPARRPDSGARAAHGRSPRTRRAKPRSRGAAPPRSRPARARREGPRPARCPHGRSPPPRDR